MPFTRRRRGRSTITRRKRRFTGRFRKRRATGGRRRRKSFIRTMPLAGLPMKKLIKFRFVGGANIDPAAGSLAFVEIEANDCFDPDVGGQQPLGWDQWQAFYESYRVISSKIVVNHTPVSNAANVPGGFCVTLQSVGAPSVFASLLQLRETNLRRSSIVSIGGGLVRGVEARSVSMTYSARKMFANPRDDQLIGGTDGTPAIGQAVKYTLYYGSPDNSNNPTVAWFTWEVTYIVQLTNRRILARS